MVIRHHRTSAYTVAICLNNSSSHGRILPIRIVHSGTHRRDDALILLSQDTFVILGFRCNGLDTALFIRLNLVDLIFVSLMALLVAHDLIKHLSSRLGFVQLLDFSGIIPSR